MSFDEVPVYYSCGTYPPRTRSRFIIRVAPIPPDLHGSGSETPCSKWVKTLKTIRFRPQPGHGVVGKRFEAECGCELCWGFGQG